jgi:tRNA-2-methylthio-N6-dimethylallyladenosine synthase
MKKYYIETFGCQMNVHDSEKMSGILKSEGHVRTDNPRLADILIFNTCSIRHKAEQKFYSQLGRFRSLKKRSPEIKIAVAGCIAQQEGSKILQRAPYVDFIIGPQNIHALKDIVKSEPYRLVLDDNPYVTEIELPIERDDSVKAWVNIMYGCNNFCSYCVVPYTRGREQSRASESIIKEVRDLAERGYREVTLLGQNVNSYKNDVSFAGLLKEINKIDGIKRIRFVTSHPKDLSDELIYAMRDMEKICEHIHLPLQSGSSKILGLMNRGYSYDDYRYKVEKLRQEIPQISITSDIIAGFPQESDEDHRCTINALSEMQFDGIFSFKFSPRPKTKASEMEGQLEDRIKSERLAEILLLQDTITEKKNKALEGSFQEILVEGKSEKNATKWSGRTRTNKIVVIPARNNVKVGDIITVKIIKANKHSLEGSII